MEEGEERDINVAEGDGDVDGDGSSNGDSDGGSDAR